MNGWKRKKIANCAEWLNNYVQNGHSINNACGFYVLLCFGQRSNTNASHVLYGIPYTYWIQSILALTSVNMQTMYKVRSKFVRDFMTCTLNFSFDDNHFSWCWCLLFFCINAFEYVREWEWTKKEWFVHCSEKKCANHKPSIGIPRRGKSHQKTTFEKRHRDIIQWLSMKSFIKIKLRIFDFSSLC